MIEQQTSTLSKKWKTPAQKKAAAARNKANGDLRASLHAQKSTAGNADKRAELQRMIDNIGAGKAS